MSIAVPILPGGHFPCKDLGRELEPQELEPLGAASLNHPSFSCLQDEDGVVEPLLDRVSVGDGGDCLANQEIAQDLEDGSGMRAVRACRARAWQAALAA